VYFDNKVPPGAKVFTTEQGEPIFAWNCDKFPAAQIEAKFIFYFIGQYGTDFVYLPGQIPYGLPHRYETLVVLFGYRKRLWIGPALQKKGQ
jgi:hypothetical protein